MGSRPSATRSRNSTLPLVLSLATDRPSSEPKQTPVLGPPNLPLAMCFRVAIGPFEFWCGCLLTRARRHHAASFPSMFPKPPRSTLVITRVAKFLIGARCGINSGTPLKRTYPGSDPTTVPVIRPSRREVADTARSPSLSCPVLSCPCPVMSCPCPVLPRPVSVLVSVMQRCRRLPPTPRGRPPPPLRRLGPHQHTRVRQMFGVG